LILVAPAEQTPSSSTWNLRLEFNDLMILSVHGWMALRGVDFVIANFSNEPARPT
jgi:hypothetical protein